MKLCPTPRGTTARQTHWCVRACPRRSVACQLSWEVCDSGLPGGRPPKRQTRSARETNLHKGSMQGSDPRIRTFVRVCLDHRIGSEVPREQLNCKRSRMLPSNTAGQWGPAEGPKCLQLNNAEHMP
jgi:hypothetical protein